MLGAACPPELTPFPFRRPLENAVDQDRLNPCRERPFGLYGEWESESCGQLSVNVERHDVQTL
jgi:hypothetical protein